MAYVFSIEEFATFDGPGIRMTVFLKGCPLSCVWCHNPEGQSPEPEYMRSPNGCLGCGACERAGERTADGRIKLSADSVKACPRSLVRVCGIFYTPQQLAEKVLKNARILTASGGGVTFSGGEPLFDPKYLFAVLDLLENKVHRAIQTTGFASPTVFAEALKRVEYVLYDLKLMDENAHKKYCGATNAPILENYRTLAKSGKDFVTRIPLIPAVTDTEENLTAIARFMQDCKVDYVELLPYNKLAGAKYANLLRDYSPDFDGAREVNLGTEIFAAHGITAKKM